MTEDLIILFGFIFICFLLLILEISSEYPHWDKFHRGKVSFVKFFFQQQTDKSCHPRTHHFY